ncbi:MAG TPA: hypothetical protein VFD64_11445 [Gemmatimonadaceae bacterium]|nr:hypothetical protein [Gemmatimonadaceae bacterium]
MTSIRCAVRSGIAAVFVLAAQACDDDEPTGSTGSIQVTVAPATVSITQGTTGFVTATLAREGGFGGVVSLTVSNLPDGVTATMEPAQLSGATTTARVNLTATGTATPATSTVTINASAPGVSNATATFALTITVAPAYELSLVPPALTIVAGTSGNTTVNITRTNLIAGVALQLVHPDPGIAGVFTPSPAMNSSALVVSVASSVSPGIYLLDIAGTATGLAGRTARLTLTVAPPPPAGNNVDYQFCDPLDAPVFFARQDGAGAWQAVAGVTAAGITRFAFNVASGHGGVMMVFRSSSEASGARRLSASRPATKLRGRLVKRQPVAAQAAVVDLYETFVFFGSTAELTADGVDTCAPTLPVKTMRGTVTGVAPGQYGVVSLGGVTTYFDGAASTNPVTFEGVKDGLIDFIGSRIVTPGLPPDRALVFRNLNIADGGSVPTTIDFNSNAAIVPATATATITGAAGDSLEVFVELVTPTVQQLFWSDLKPSQVSTRPWAGLGPAAMVTGEFHNVLVFASAALSDDFRYSSKSVTAVANESIAFGPPANAVATSLLASGTYPRFRFTGTLPAEYNKGVIVGLLGSAEPANAFSALITNSYMTAAGTALTYDIAMPDVVGLPGFPTASRLTAGTNLVTTDAIGFTGAGIFEVRPAVGNESRGSVRFTQITVP